MRVSDCTWTPLHMDTLGKYECNQNQFLLFCSHVGQLILMKQYSNSFTDFLSLPFLLTLSRFSVLFSAKGNIKILVCDNRTYTTDAVDIY